MRINDSWLKKGLVLSVILLFIGVAVAPSINIGVVKASTDDDLVEVTTQVCGIKGYGDTTVKLTREQYRNLEQYLVEFRARLNQTSTREEAVPIFKDVVVELEKYGLLPKGMSVEQAQKLVIGHYPNVFQNKIQEKSHTSDICKNLLCLIAGDGKDIGFLPFIGIIYYPIYGIGLTLSILFFVMNFLTHSFTMISKFFALVESILYNILIRLSDYFLEKRQIVFGSDAFYWWGYGRGWIHTFGLFGNKNFSGNLEGVLPYYIPGFKYFLILRGSTGRGVSGFNGIRVYYDVNSVYYIGNALQVKIRHWADP